MGEISAIISDYLTRQGLSEDYVRDLVELMKDAVKIVADIIQNRYQEDTTSF